MQVLKDKGMLEEPLHLALHEDVLPWLMDKMNNFLFEDKIVGQRAGLIVNDGILTTKEQHKNTLKKRKESLQ